MDPLEQLLARDAGWRPSPADAEAWAAEADRAGGPAELLHEARWWRAWAAAGRGEWDRVSALAAEGLGPSFSEREAIRLALLHAVSGNLDEAQHVLAQAVQWTGGEALLRRFAERCEAEGLTVAAERFWLLSGSRPPSAARR